MLIIITQNIIFCSLLIKSSSTLLKTELVFCELFNKVQIIFYSNPVHAIGNRIFYSMSDMKQIC